MAAARPPRTCSPGGTERQSCTGFFGRLGTCLLNAFCVPWVCISGPIIRNAYRGAAGISGDPLVSSRPSRSPPCVWAAWSSTLRIAAAMRSTGPHRADASTCRRSGTSALGAAPRAARPAKCTGTTKRTTLVPPAYACIHAVWQGACIADNDCRAEKLARERERAEAAKRKEKEAKQKARLGPSCPACARVAARCSSISH
jgi:hypothetical protein